MAKNRHVPNLAVFCSGEGTNLRAILSAIRAKRLRACVALVVSDRREARALDRAKRAGVEGRWIDPHAYPTKTRYERTLIRLLETHHVRLVCLAGFMRVLSPVFVRHYPHRILNVHPALLPAFPGAHGVRDALAWGVRVTGVTIHFVDAMVDHGPIIAQEAVAVAPHDTEAAVLRKVHRVEHRLYPEAIQRVLEGRAKIVGRTVKTG